MFLCSHLNGLEPPDTLYEAIRGVPDLRGLVIPAGRSPRLVDPRSDSLALGPRGAWLASAMESLRTAFFLDPGFSLLATLGSERVLPTLERLAEQLVAVQLGEVPVGRVVGDNLLDRLEELMRSGIDLRNRYSGEGFTELAAPILSAQAELGAAPYVHAVEEGCRVVLGGAAAPGALAMGLLHEMLGLETGEWDRHDWSFLGSVLLHAAAMEAASQCLGVGEGTESGHQELGFTLPRDGGQDATESLAQSIERVLVALAGTDPPRTLHLPDITLQWEMLRWDVNTAGRLVLRGVTAGPPAGGYPVQIVYQLGVRAQLVARLGGSDPATEAVTLGQELAHRFPLTSNGFRKQGCLVMTQQSSERGAGDLKLVVELFEQTPAQLDKLYRSAYAELAPLDQVAVESPLVPDMTPNYETWHTSVPREAIDWEVEVRPARGWG